MDRTFDLPSRLILIVFGVILGFLMAGVALGQAYHPGQEPKIVQPGEIPADQVKVYSAVCRLNVPGGTGSGTLVAVRGNLGLVLSCRHVCNQVGDRVVVSWMSGEMSVGVVYHVVYGRGFDTDLALVVCQAPRGIKSAKVGKFNPENTPFVGVGWRESKLRVANCPVASVTETGLVFTNRPFIQGMSGGALFDRRGRLVAVVVGMSSPYKSAPYDTGISVDGPQLHNLLRQFGD